MGRKIAAVVGALVVWMLVATILNWIMRMGWPGYVEAEGPMTFTPSMLAGRLVVGGLSSIGAGLALALIARDTSTTAVVSGLLLTALFVPVHYYLWDKFPVWYHAVFLVSLLPLVALGARLIATRRA